MREAFLNLSATIIKGTIPTLTMLAESGHAFGTPLVLLGDALTHADSALLKFAGTAMIVGGILMGRLTDVINILLGKIGSVS